MTPGTLYYGDCLEWMDCWPDECVDLVYLDPPFNSQTNYNVLFSAELAGEAQFQAFADTWQWDEAAGERMAMFEGAIANPLHDAVCGLFRLLGPSGMMAYLTYMAERLLPTRRLLKPTGSIYLHCDPTASHYLKALMDAIYGGRNFRNEITWRRINPTGRASRRFANNADTILYYGKSDQQIWNPQFLPHDPEYVKRMYRYKDEAGRLYRLGDLKGAGTRKGSSGKPWRGVDPNETGSHWAIPNKALPEDATGLSSQDKLDLLDDMGRIYWPEKGKVPSYKRYLDEMPGTPVDNIWNDISGLSSKSSERLGYDTQKPLALLERIILASSNEGQIVLDPFCGCGTSVEAAHKLNREWVGIDISPYAIDVIRNRRKGLQDVPIQTDGIPNSLSAARMLAREKPFAFETWAVCRLPGFAPNDPKFQIGDRGIDGRGKLAEKPENYPSRLALAQVKGGKFSASQFRDFMHVLERDKAAVGCFLTLDPIPASARADAKQYGSLKVAGQHYDRLHPFSIRDYFDRRPPVLPAMLDPYTGKPVYQMALL